MIAALTHVWPLPPCLAGSRPFRGAARTSAGRYRKKPFSRSLITTENYCPPLPWILITPRMYLTWIQQSNILKTWKKKIARLSGMKSDLMDEANRQLPTPLSQREIEVLQMLACGTTNVEIAQSLNISPHTVKSHITHIFNKLGVNSRTQASVWATQQHFV
ncbi:MAG: response regulator transcription factor [Desulfobacula sp.]|nr:response regulator transcription factor [Desulfobacula sp.]